MRTAIRTGVTLLVALVCCVLAVRPASALNPGPAWEISSVAHPTNFSVEDNTKCATQHGFPLCDQYLVTFTNVGSEPSSGPVTIVDTLPQGLEAVGASDENTETRERGGCALAVEMVTCTYEGDGGTVMPGATVVVFVKVNVIEVEGKLPVGEITNSVKISGGGAPSVSTSLPLTQANTVGGTPAMFGISAFSFAAHDASGSLDTQAGDHPYGVTSTVNLNTILTDHPHERYRLRSRVLNRRRILCFICRWGCWAIPLRRRSARNSSLRRLLSNARRAASARSCFSLTQV